MTETPRDWSSKDVVEEAHEHPADVTSRPAVIKAWTPWIILSVFVFIWGTPQFKTFLDGLFIAKLAGPRPEQPGHEGAAGGGRGPCRGCRVQLQHALGHGHRHPAVGPDREA